MLCFFSAIARAQDNSSKTITNHYANKDLKFTDSMPAEFSIDISNYSFICKPNTFELYEHNKNLNFTRKLFTLDAAIKPFFLPVNELTLMFSINNSAIQEQIVYLKLGNPDLFKIACLDDTTLPIQTGGFLGKTNRLSPFSPNKFLSIQIPAKATRTYLAYAKFMGSYKEQIVPLLFSGKSYQLYSIKDIDKNRLQLVYHNFIIGGIFIISLFMFAQFFLTKDKTFLYYAAYGLFIFLVSEKIMEHNCGIYLISYFFPNYVFYSHVILQLLASFFYIRFIVSILNVTKEHKAIYIYSNTMQKLILLGCVLYCYVISIDEKSVLASVVYNYGTLLSTVCMLPLLILLFIKKEKDLALKFILTGFSVVVIAALTAVYINRSGLNSRFTYLAPVSIVELAVFVEMIFFGMALGHKTFKQKKEKEHVELQKKETEMAALKAQMNPHFMFNCINSIDAFIQTNDKYNATLYLNKFAKLIRNVLDSSKQNTVPFSKDIDTLKLYIQLEELRSENKFTTQLTIDEELMNGDYKVPPLIIQPFVENAIIHGLRNKQCNDGILQIMITKEKDCIAYSIKDNGIGRKAAATISSGKEKSYGMDMSFDRIKLFNKEEKASVTITDIYEKEEPAGTIVQVILKTK